MARFQLIWYFSIKNICITVVDGYYSLGVDKLYATDVTDADGAYLFTGLPMGKYVVDVVKAGPIASAASMSSNHLYNAINSGAIFMNYSGHSGVRQLGEETEMVKHYLRAPVAVDRLFVTMSVEKAK